MILIPLLVTLLVLLFTFYKIRYGFWKRKNFPYIEPKIPFGNFVSPSWNVSLNIQMANHYYTLKKRGEIHGGVYQIIQPVYLPVDTKLIKTILTKDFGYFMAKGLYVNEEDQPMSGHLFAIGGEKWRILRQKMTPTFTSGKMKMMLDTLLECRKPLIEEIERVIEKKSCFDIKESAAKFTTDVIASVAFGINSNSFKEEDSEFRKHGRDIFNVTSSRFLKIIFTFTFGTLAKILKTVPFPIDTEKFFTGAIKDMIDYRANNKIVRNDFLQLMINLMNKGNVDGATENSEMKITFDEVVAQAFVFFLAGFETSSTTTTYAMFELAQNQDIQDKARKEINEVLKKYDGKITYEALQEMTYLKQVIDEALRKYPPLATIDRKCTRDYKVPGTDSVIPAGVPVVISTLGLHRDPDYFPDPEKFDPERFSKENIGNIKEFTYMPFGEGPRLCIGMRFGIMQSKIGLITLLKDYRFTLNEKTPAKAEIGLGFVLTIKGDVLLNVERIKN